MSLTQRQAEEPEQTHLSELGDQPRVELRRFLAGIPFSHSRELSSDERKRIKRLLRPYAIYGITFLLLTLPFITAEFARKQEGVETFFGLVILLLLSMPTFCVYWAWPYLKALRSNRVDVYIGPLRSLQGYDVAQDFYLGRSSVGQHIDRYVELHAVAEGRRIWRLEGIENGENLAEVRPIEAALVPDQDERGRRPLTQEEKAEISRRARELRRKTPVVMALLGAALLAGSIGGFLGLAFPSLSFFPFLILLAIFSFVGINPIVGNYALGNLLERDIRAGYVEDGNLNSGLPWVVEGMPARWRLAWLRGASGRKLTYREARRLDADRAGQSPEKSRPD